MIVIAIQAVGSRINPRVDLAPPFVEARHFDLVALLNEVLLMTTILAQVILAWIKGRGVDLQDAFVGVLEVQGIEVVRGRLVPQAIIGEQEKGLEGELADGHQRGTSIEEMIVRDLHIEGGIALGLLTVGPETFHRGEIDLARPYH